MSAIQHHVSDELLAAYAAGNLSHAFSLVVASHVSLCEQCRAGLEAHNVMGGVCLDETKSVTVSSGLKTDLLSRLDDPMDLPKTFARKGALPGPIVAALKGKDPTWKKVGQGVRQDILSEGDGGTARLLYIPAGQAVPDHSHNGLEMTLVLQGSFSDETGRYGVGDVEIADESLEHTPVADPGEPCICLAATDAPLRFRAFIPRLMQPIFRI